MLIKICYELHRLSIECSTNFQNLTRFTCTNDHRGGHRLEREACIL